MSFSATEEKLFCMAGLMLKKQLRQLKISLMKL
nr:MAG TPA: hypothetical protein [Caudoviricetes sp.]